MKGIKEKRAEMGVTQVQLAALAGMDPATLNRIEQGKANPNLKTIERLADALEVEVGDFFPKDQAPLPLEVDGGRGLQLWRQHASDLADDLEELAEGGETMKWERRFGRAEGAAFVALGTITTIEGLLSLIKAGGVRTSSEEVRGLLRAGFRLAKAADRIDELAAPNEEDLMRGVQERGDRILTEFRFRKIVENAQLSTQDREEIFA